MWCRRCRRKLRAGRRRQEVGLQAAQGRHVPQRQAGDGGRRRRLASCITVGENSKSAAKSLLRRSTAIKADGAETVVFELTSGNADFPYIALRLSHADHAEEGRRHGRLGIGHPHRPLHARQVQPGVSCHLQQEPQLLQVRQGLVRPRRVPGDQGRRRRAPTRCNTGEIQYMHRCRPEDARSAQAEPERRHLREARAMATTST